jgi:tRNA A-37 threonylcarbamoyl transferase component Bud32
MRRLSEEEVITENDVCMIIKKVLNIINEFHDNDMTLGNIEALNLFFRGKKVDSGVIFRDFGIDKIL